MCIRLRSSALISWSFAIVRSRRDFRLRRKLPRRDLLHNSVKARKLKVSGFPRPRFSRLAAAWRPNSISRVFSGWSGQGEPLEPLTHRIEETTSVVLVLEADSQIIGVSHDDHVAGGFAPSPALGPDIEAVVQVDIGEERRNYAPNAKDNFRFERTIVEWRSGDVLDLRRKR